MSFRSGSSTIPDSCQRAAMDGVASWSSEHRPDGWDRHDRVFTGLLDGRVVAFGHVGAAHGEGADGELYGFYVHPNAWATGIADALIDRCHCSCSLTASTMRCSGC